MYLGTGKETPINYFRPLSDPAEDNPNDETNGKTIQNVQLVAKLGTGKVNRSDEFSEKFQTAFDPPPHFRKVTLRFSRQNCDKSAYVHMEEHLCIL